MDRCPSEEQLAGFSAGICPDDQAADIQAHLDACPSCARWVADARGDENLLPGVQDALRAWDKQAGPDHGSAEPDGSPETQPVPTPTSPAMPAIEGYEFIRELHRGGQGVVYQAVQASTKRKVAIKLLLDEQNLSPSARSRFEREIELAANLKHPNIVAVFDSGTTTNGRRFCVMDYVRGQKLNEYVRENKLSLEDTLNLFGKVCQAVNYAHQKGVIHRDLKPSNILVDADGNPKVLDFGLAKTVGGPEQTVISLTGQVVGTLPYISPEQARGNPDEIDIRTDVYALGVILYELLTGHYPYPVAGNMAVVLKHIAETPPTLPSRAWAVDSGVTDRTAKRSHAGRCPIDGEVETIVLQALTKERDRRYQGAGELARDIGHYLAGESIDAKRDSGFYVLRKALRRYRVSIAVGAGFALVIVAALVVVAIYARRDAQRAVVERELREENAELRQVNEDLERETRGLLPAGAPIPAEAVSDDAQGVLALADLRQQQLALAQRNLALDRRKGQATTLWAFVSSSNLQGAMEYLDQQLCDSPNDAYLMAYRGYLRVKLYERTKELALLESARHDYQTSMALDSAYAAEAHEGIGHTYYYQASRSKTDDDYRRAIAEYSKAIEARPGFLRAHSNRGHAHLQVQQHAQAVADYAIATTPGFKELSESVHDAWRTYDHYGAVLRLLGASEEAEIHYRQAVSEAPEDEYVYAALALALVYRDLGRDAEADDCLELAREKAESGTWEEKLADCLSLDLSPEDLIDTADESWKKCEAYYYAGEAWIHRGKQEEARRAFQTCVAECESGGCTDYFEYRWAQWRLSQLNLFKMID